MKQHTLMKKRVYRWYNSTIRNAWIHTKTTSVYLRKSSRIIDGVKINVIDLANVNVHEKYQNNGYFKSLILFLESLDTVYIENVLNDKLAESLLNNGYRQVNHRCFIKHCEN
jgi:hypothetical protein